MTEHQMPSGNCTQLTEATAAEITALRQQHRNVFAERCRLANVRPPDAPTMNAWWPGTKATFA